MSARLVSQLQARGRVLARAAMARLRDRVAQRWAGLGALADDGDGLRLTGPGLRQRRRGSRARLAEPELLWPGEE